MEGDFFQGWGGVRQALILSLCDGGFEINFCLMRGVHNFSQTSLKVIIALFLMKMKIKKREELNSIFLAEQILVIMSVSTLSIANVWQGSWRSFLKKCQKRAFVIKPF